MKSRYSKTKEMATTRVFKIFPLEKYADDLAASAAKYDVSRSVVEAMLNEVHGTSHVMVNYDGAAFTAVSEFETTLPSKTKKSPPKPTEQEKSPKQAKLSHDSDDDGF